MSRLAELPGKRVCFKAMDSNNIQGIKCPAPEVVYFKEGAPVMHGFIQHQLQDPHGTRAIFLRKLEDHSAVINVDGGEYTIPGVTWTNLERVPD